MDCSSVRIQEPTRAAGWEFAPRSHVNSHKKAQNSQRLCVSCAFLWLTFLWLSVLGLVCFLADLNSDDRPFQSDEGAVVVHVFSTARDHFFGTFLDRKSVV